MESLANLCSLESIPSLGAWGGMTGSFGTAQGIPPRRTGELLLKASCIVGKRPSALAQGPGRRKSKGGALLLAREPKMSDARF